MKTPSLRFILGLILGVLLLTQAWSLSPAEVSGRYRCYSYNVGGAGGSCRTFTTIFILNNDKTYTFGKTKGTYIIEKATIQFSEEKQRGPAAFFDGNKFRFTFTSSTTGWKIEQTYLRIE